MFFFCFFFTTNRFSCIFTSEKEKLYLIKCIDILFSPQRMIHEKFDMAQFQMYFGFINIYLFITRKKSGVKQPHDFHYKLPHLF